eukprot:Nitzschia sp. Nitz4//scaffold50_size126154//82567//83107//NITZ4_003691-RA/size126154-augustus-gene-0.129-mRNA-1//-1//CDS//3329553716//3634//frame0
MYTTNEEDQREAARLQARLQENPAASTASERHVMPNVSMDEGKNKYVLISAMLDDQRQHFVVSRLGAQYHRNAAEPFVEALERSGYSSIRILGGGRIDLNTKHKTISIYGYSYGFGLADHALSQSIVEKDSRYEGFDISWSNEGY